MASWIAGARYGPGVGYASHDHWTAVIAPECKRTSSAQDSAWPCANCTRRRAAAELRAADPAAFAHCWVANERLGEDLRECLRAYEAHANASLLPAEWAALERGLAEPSSLLPPSKQLWTRAKRHPDCQSVFTRGGALEQLVFKLDGALFRALGYESCCTPRNLTAAALHGQAAAMRLWPAGPWGHERPTGRPRPRAVRPAQLPPRQAVRRDRPRAAPAPLRKPTAGMKKDIKPKGKVEHRAL